MPTLSRHNAPGSRAGGFALIASLLLTVLASVAALEAFNRSQLDAQLARHAVARTQADVAAAGFLDALLQDISDMSDPVDPAANPFIICAFTGPCDPRFQRVSDLRELVPKQMQPSVSIVKLPAERLPLLPEQRSSSIRLGERRALEARVEILGAARASIATVFVLPVSGTSGDRELR